MAFLGFLNLIFKCFDLLAWPLFALGYPLCASIRAIETNSNHHMRELVTYWILFSLISLFELAFVKLIEWVPLWQYIKLGTVCWLVLPQFNGAHYCYKSFVHPCLSVNIKEVMNKLYKRQEASLGKDIFLSVAERYVAENGTEALEKLIASKGSRTDFGVEEIKAVADADAENIFLSPTVKDLKSCCNEFNVNQKDINKVEIPGKNSLAAENWSYCNEFDADQKDINEVELPEKNALVSSNWIKNRPSTANGDSPVIEGLEGIGHFNHVKPVETVHVQAEKKTIAAVEVKEVTVPPFPLPVPAAAAEKMPSEKVQKEWTCAACQVTTTCEENLNSHLLGRKHIAKCEELKSKGIKLTAKNKASLSSSSPASKAAQANQDSKKSVSGDRLNQNKTTKKQEEKVTVKVKCEELKSKGIKLMRAKNKASLPSSSPASKAAQANQDSKKSASGDRLNQDKTKKQEENVTVKVNSKPGKQNRNNNSNSESKRLKYWCPDCAVTCLSAIDFLSHLNGKKHLAEIQERFVKQ